MECGRYPVADAIREKLPGAVVEHKCGPPFMVYSTVDGKKSTKECLPLYFFCPACVSKRLCKSALDKTADHAVAASESGGGPKAESMER